MTVFVVDTGEYEENHVVGVFSSLNKATEYVKTTFAPKDKPARWEYEALEDGGGILTRFRTYSAPHEDRTDFHINSYELDGQLRDDLPPRYPERLNEFG